ncbi:MAG: polyprenyl synthetase family protein [Prevotella sp.]|nr:polyprenyl synthetase family protein [Prevotella sp.]
MQYNTDELLGMVNRALDEERYNRQPVSLYEPIKYVLSMGGKRIRPVLMLLSYNLYKDNPADILVQAVGLETFHNFTLLHDDLMDRADLRRGHATVHKRWNDNTAILSGDSMLVLAYQKMLRCDQRHLAPVMELFTETALQINEGQKYDMDFETRNDVTVEEYVEMIRLKTIVLLGCALKMGAILADAPAADADLLYRFGEQIGLAFQLQDDLLDVYGDEKVFGKAIGGDITVNKKTYLLINALNQATPEQHAELMRWMGAENFDRQEKIAAVTRIYNEIGVRELCEEKIRHHFEQGMALLERVSVTPERKEQLRRYTAAMVNRQF